MKVLLLEPFTEMRVLMRGVLRAMGVKKLFEPRSSLEAMQILLTDPIDFFICSDAVKPLDALLCMKLIRNAREEHIRYIRTIVSVNNYEQEDIDALKDAGCDYILPKPFSADDITSQIFRLIRNRNAFIECKAYVGPDRRVYQEPLKFEERRDESFNPGRAVFNHGLSRLIQRLYDAKARKQAQKDKERENELLARGIFIEDGSVEERIVCAADLRAGMILRKAIQSTSGMLVLPANHSLGEKSIARVQDLVQALRVEDSFSILVEKS